MQCPLCGGLQVNSAICDACGRKLADEFNSAGDLNTIEAYTLETQTPDHDSPLESSYAPNKQVSRLIEFPGVSRPAMPEWRKTIAERVRESQERRAREAAAEAENNPSKTAPQLELIPQTEASEMNPILAAALKRLERAYSTPPPTLSPSTRPLAAVAYATEPGYDPYIEESEPASRVVVQPASEINVEEETITEVEERATERVHNLVVVPPTPMITSQPQNTVATTTTRKRIISDDTNNPALNYLDSVPTMLRVETSKDSAPAIRRICAGIVDLMIVALLCSPFAIATDWLRADWQSVKMIALATTMVLLVGFVYSTVSTALTGRTFGMRLLGLRVVDERTGLIPTGSQSAGRAVLYLLSLLSAGLVLIYALIDQDRRAAHDRFTKTAVIAV
jgi:uncharacterized RDD family membrane protein YckC